MKRISQAWRQQTVSRNHGDMKEKGCGPRGDGRGHRSGGSGFGEPRLITRQSFHHRRQPSNNNSLNLPDDYSFNSTFGNQSDDDLISAALNIEQNIADAENPQQTEDKAEIEKIKEHDQTSIIAKLRPRTGNQGQIRGGATNDDAIKTDVQKKPLKPHVTFNEPHNVESNQGVQTQTRASSRILSANTKQCVKSVFSERGTDIKSTPVLSCKVQTPMKETDQNKIGHISNRSSPLVHLSKVTTPTQIRSGENANLRERQKETYSNLTIPFDTQIETGSRNMMRRSAIRNDVLDLPGNSFNSPLQMSTPAEHSKKSCLSRVFLQRPQGTDPLNKVVPSTTPLRTQISHHQTKKSARKLDTCSPGLNLAQSVKALRQVTPQNKTPVSTKDATESLEHLKSKTVQIPTHDVGTSQEKTMRNKPQSGPSHLKQPTKTDESPADSLDVSATKTITTSKQQAQDLNSSQLLLSAWGLPEDVEKRYMEVGIRELFPWQVECLCAPGVLDGGNLVYSAPTSAGKTLVAEILLLKRVLETKKKAIFILPFVSVAREKTLNLQHLFDPVGIKVEGFMGGRNPAGGFAAVDVAICTIEKANSLVNRLLNEGDIDKLGAVIVDELHMVGDDHRGYLLELLLTKIRYMTSRQPVTAVEQDTNTEASSGETSVQIIGMSATLPNLDLLGHWLNATIYVTDYRPIPLTECVKLGKSIFDKNMKKLRDVSVPAVTMKGDEDNVLSLCLETLESGRSVLIFCPTKSWCEKLAFNLAGSLYQLNKVALQAREGQQDGEGFVPSGVLMDKKSLRDVIEQLRRTPVGLDKMLAQVVPQGAAFHHAGLTFDERDIVESAFRHGSLRVLVATSTLSSGVNLPARRVIIRTPTFHGKIIDTRTYKQMVGRAGRKGVDTEGDSILVCKESERSKARTLLSSDLPPVHSCLLRHQGGDTISSSMKRAILEVVVSGVARSPADVQTYAACTMLAADSPGDDAGGPGGGVASKGCSKGLIDSCIKFLADSEFIILKKSTDQDGGDEEVYEATLLGKGVLSSALSPDEGLIVFAELQRARRNFVLENELHIIYQVTPIYQVCTTIDWYHYMCLMDSLSPGERRVAECVGVSENYLARCVQGRVPCSTPAQQRSLAIHRRYYTALVLQELVKETPLSVVADKYHVTRGVLQSLQQAAATFSGMVTAFCSGLGWTNLELLLAQFQSRLTFGIQRELTDLVRVSLLNARRARTLYNAGFHTVAALANAHPDQVEALLRAAVPFQSLRRVEEESEWERGERQKVRCISVSGQKGLSESEAAILIIDEARHLVEADLGMAGIQWAEVKPQGSSEASGKEVVSGKAVKESPVKKASSGVSMNVPGGAQESSNVGMTNKTRKESGIENPSNIKPKPQDHDRLPTVINKEEGTTPVSEQSAKLKQITPRTENRNYTPKRQNNTPVPLKDNNPNARCSQTATINPESTGIHQSTSDMNVGVSRKSNPCDTSGVGMNGQVQKLGRDAPTRDKVEKTSIHIQPKSAQICNQNLVAPMHKQSLNSPLHEHNKSTPFRNKSLNPGINVVGMKSPIQDKSMNSPTLQNSLDALSMDLDMDSPIHDQNLNAPIHDQSMNSQIHDRPLESPVRDKEINSGKGFLNDQGLNKPICNPNENTSIQDEGMNAPIQIQDASGELYTEPMEDFNDSFVFDTQLVKMVTETTTIINNESNNSSNTETKDEHSHKDTSTLSVASALKELNGSASPSSRPVRESPTTNEGKITDKTDTNQLQSSCSPLPSSAKSGNKPENLTYIISTAKFPKEQAIRFSKKEPTSAQKQPLPPNPCTTLDLSADDDLELFMDGYSTQETGYHSDPPCLNKQSGLVRGPRKELKESDPIESLTLSKASTLSSSLIESPKSPGLKIVSDDVPRHLPDSLNAVLPDDLGEEPWSPRTRRPQFRVNQSPVLGLLTLPGLSGHPHKGGHKRNISPCDVTQTEELAYVSLLHDTSTLPELDDDDDGQHHNDDGLKAKEEVVEKTRHGRKEENPGENKAQEQTARELDLSQYFMDNFGACLDDSWSFLPPSTPTTASDLPKRPTTSDNDITSPARINQPEQQGSIDCKDEIKSKKRKSEEMLPGATPGKQRRVRADDNRTMETPKERKVEENEKKSPNTSDCVPPTPPGSNADTPKTQRKKSQHTQKRTRGSAKKTTKGPEIRTKKNRKEETGPGLKRGLETVMESDRPSLVSETIPMKNFRKVDVKQGREHDSRRSTRSQTANSQTKEPVPSSFMNGGAQLAAGKTLLNKTASTESTSYHSVLHPTHSFHSQLPPLTHENFTIIDVAASKALFDQFLVEWSCAERSSLCLACERFTRAQPAAPQRPVAIGARFRQGGASAVVHPVVESMDRGLVVEGTQLRLVGLAVSWENRDAYYVSLLEEDETDDLDDSLSPPPLDPRLSPSHRIHAVLKVLAGRKTSGGVTCKRIMFDMREQMNTLARATGRQIQGDMQDPKVGAWLLDPGAKEMSLHRMVQNKLPLDTYMMEGLGGGVGLTSLGLSPENPGSARVRSCIEVVVVGRLMASLEEDLIKEDLMRAFSEVEMPTQVLLSHMELNGFGFSEEECEHQKAMMIARLEVLEESAYQLAGRPFSLSSPDDIAQVLFIELKLPPSGDPLNPMMGCKTLGPARGRRGKRVPYSTSKDVLEKLRGLHPLPGLVLEWRRITMAMTKVVFPLTKERVHSESLQMSRIFAVCQTHTATGRISLAEPNLQNIPKDFEIDVTGGIILAADYSQLELRIIAHLSGDKRLKTILNEGSDVFKLIAAEWKGIEVGQVTSEHRQQAKQVCYGMLYGIGAKALGEQLSVSEEDATVFMETFKDKYRGLRSFLRSCVTKCRDNGYVETIYHRRRYLPAIHDNNLHAKAHAERQAVNTTVQGSAADLVKLAMVKIEQNLEANFTNASPFHHHKRSLRDSSGAESRGQNLSVTPRAYFLLQLHDELIYEVNTDILHQVAYIVKETMETAMALDVKLPVKVKCGPSWGKLSEMDL